jgi:hypothetical protein
MLVPYDDVRGRLNQTAAQFERFRTSFAVRFPLMQTRNGERYFDAAELRQWAEDYFGSGPIRPGDLVEGFLVQRRGGRR